MKYFDIKGDKVSRLGYGCMRFPIIDGDNAKIDEDKAEEQLLHGIENGINYIDTAYVYHGKTSEKFVGKIIEKHNLRDKLFLVTKIPCWMVEKYEDFEKFLDEQLSNLRTDYLDFCLLHTLDLKVFRKIKELGVFDFIKKAVDDGKIRHIGFSFHDEYPAFEEIVKSYDWDFCQIQLNYLDIDYQAGLKGYELATSLGIPVVIMEPLKGGKLSNPPEEILKIYEQFKPLSPSQQALKFAFSLSNVMTVLSGMNDIKQIDENIKIASCVDPDSLTDDDIDFYKRAREIYKAKERIGCTACEYCMPCTVEINIPHVFSLWNNAFLFDEEEKSKENYKKYIEEKPPATDCIECAKCEAECPQQLDIIEGLKQAHEYLTK